MSSWSPYGTRSPALAYDWNTLASVKKRSGGEPVEKPWDSCRSMSEAAITSTVLPVLASHGLTVSCWSLVSAAPFEVIIILIVTGPEAAGWTELPPETSPPSLAPQATRPSTPVRQATRTAVACLVVGGIDPPVPRTTEAGPGWSIEIGEESHRRHAHTGPGGVPLHHPERAILRACGDLGGALGVAEKTVRGRERGRPQILGHRSGEA